MTTNNIFSESEIPYNILQKYGITQEMIDDLPQDIMEILLQGGRTPLLPIEVDNGSEKIKGKASISFKRTGNGVDIVFTNKWRKAKLDEYDIEEQNALRAGLVLLRRTNNDELVYLQLDEKTNAVMTASAEAIQHNIEVYKNELGCSTEESEKMSQGNAVTLKNSNEVLTIGIDLHEPDGIRFVPVEVSRLKDYKPATDRQNYNFGIYGCWIVGKDGSLDSYIPEENYTPEMEQMLEDSRDKNIQESNEEAESNGYKYHL